MDKIGNKKLNNILEVFCPDRTKPSPDSERKYRDAFIQSKYVFKRFMSQSSVDSSPGIYIKICCLHHKILLSLTSGFDLTLFWMMQKYNLVLFTMQHSLEM